MRIFSGNVAFSRPWADTTSLAVDPSDSAKLYAASSAGVFVSSDRGQSWVALGMIRPTKAMLLRLLLDPSNPNVAYAVFAEAELDGLYKSTDQGQRRKRINTGLPDLTTRALVIDPGDSRTLYVGTFKRGVFKSPNGGESWQPTGLCEDIEPTACPGP